MKKIKNKYHEEIINVINVKTLPDRCIIKEFN